MERGMIDSLFCQCYHILAEFEEYDKDRVLDFVHLDGQKRDLLDCLKNGFYFRLEHSLKNGSF